MSPGETLTLSVVVVGGNLETTIGIVYADFLQNNSSNNSAHIFSEESISACSIDN